MPFYFFSSREYVFIFFNKCIIIVILIILIYNIVHILSQKDNKKSNIKNLIEQCNNCSYSSYLANITNLTNIYITLTNISYYYSNEYELIEITYYIKLSDHNNSIIKTSDLPLVYNLTLLCDIYISENNESIYSIPNILIIFMEIIFVFAEENLVLI